MCEPNDQREPQTSDEERAVEADELESFRRRQQWADEVFGDAAPQTASELSKSDDDEASEEPTT